MKQLLRSVFLASTVFLTASAMAEGTGWNIGASVGASTLDLDSSSCGSYSCDKTDLGFKLTGGFTFTPNLAIELSYIDLGESTFDTTSTTGSMSETGIAASGLVIYPINEFSLFAKAGVSSLKTKLTGSMPIFSSVSSSGTKSSNDTNFAWGVGAGYAIASNISTVLEWERYKGEFSDLGISESHYVDLISIGAQYKF
jgi:OOP family OmpA-OmpF porin